MAFPNDVTLREVTFGPAFDLTSGAPLAMKVTFTPSRSMVRGAPTGSPGVAREYSVTTEEGMEGSISIPVTDQAGWFDGNGNAISTDAGGNTHSYRVRVAYLNEQGREVGSPPAAKSIALPTGDGTPVDLDALIPVTTTGGVTVSVPDAWSADVAAAAASAAAAQAALEDADTLVDDLVTDTGSATRASLNATIVAETASVATAARMRPPLPPTAASISTMIQAFASGHGWTTVFGPPTSNLNDTSDYLLGTQCVSFQCPSSASMVGVGKTGLALNMTGKALRIFVKVDDAAKIGGIRVYLGDTALTNNFNIWATFTETAPASAVRSGEWATIDLILEEAAVVGTPDRANIQNIRVLANAVAGQTPTVKFGGAALVAVDELSRWPNGVISISADDTFGSHFSILRPLMDRNGWKFTLFPIIGRIDTSTYLTTAQIRTLRDAGHEIGAHATTDATHALGMVAMSEAERRTELEALRQWNADVGAISTSYAYPLGYWNREVAVQVARYYSAARLASVPAINNSRLEDPYRVRNVNLGTTSVATVQGYIDDVKASRGFLSLFVHDIVASGATGGAITTADLTTILDYIAAQGVAVRPFGTVVAASA